MFQRHMLHLFLIVWLHLYLSVKGLPYNGEYPRVTLTENRPTSLSASGLRERDRVEHEQQAQPAVSEDAQRLWKQQHDISMALEEAENYLHNEQSPSRERQEQGVRSRRLKRFDESEKLRYWADDKPSADRRHRRGESDFISGTSPYSPSHTLSDVRSIRTPTTSNSKKSAFEFNSWKTLRMSVFKPQIVFVCKQVVRLQTAGTEVKTLFALGKMNWDSGRLEGYNYSYTVLTFNLDAEAGETWMPVDLGGSGTEIDLVDGCGVSATATPSQREVVIISCRNVMVWRDPLNNHTVTVRGQLDDEVLLNFYSAASGFQSDGERVSLFVVGANSSLGQPQVWELAFDNSTLKSAEWKMLAVTSSVGPTPRVLANLHYSNRSLILYGGSAFPSVSQPTTTLCDLWEFDLDTSSWAKYDTLKEDCMARRGCEDTQLSYIHTHTLSAYLPATDMVATIVSQCKNLPYFEVWMRKRGSGNIWTKTPDMLFSTSKNGGTPQLSYAVGSFLVSDQKDSGYLVIADYSDQETKIYNLLRVAKRNDLSSQNAVLLDVDGRENYFIGSTGCSAPPPIDIGLFIGGMCSPVPAMLDNARTTPTLIWSRTVDLRKLTSEWRQNSIRPAPAYGNRIGQSVVKVTKGGKEKAVLFGGLLSIDFLQLSARDLFFVPSELWCFEYVPGYHWQQAVLSESSEQPSPRAYQTANAVDGVVYMYGGIVENMAVSNELWRFEFTSFDKCEGKWTNITGHLYPGPPPPLYGHTANTLGNSLYIIGGAMSINVNQYVQVASRPFVLDLENLSWREMTGSLAATMESSRIFHSTTFLGTLAIVVLGGCTQALAVSGKTCFSLTNSFYAILAKDGSSNVDFLPFGVGQTPPSQNMGLYGHQSLLDPKSKMLVIFGGILEVPTSLTDVKFAKLVSPDNDVIVFQPGCPPGHASLDLMQAGCSRCPRGTYSNIDGAPECTPCPPDITTNKTGCTTAEDCSVCQPGFCGHGACSVDGLQRQPTCNCDFGYASLGITNCKIPIYYIIMGIGLLIIVIIVAACCKYRTKKRLYEKNFQMAEAQLHQELRTIEVMNKALEIDVSELTFKGRLDEESPGGFGEVRLAEYRDILVAVKKLKKHSLDNADTVREFRREAEAMKTIRHPNIVLFYGFGSYPNTQETFLVMEYVKGGTLMDKLGDKETVLDHPFRLRLALDIARAMRYLHNQNPPRIHRDLKSANLLVSEKWVVKVADFGTSRLIRTQTEREAEMSFHSDTGERTRLIQPDLDSLLSENVGTCRWMSPEILARLPYGPSTDVYSFGIILWEICCQILPYGDLHRTNQIRKKVIQGHRPTIPASCPGPFAELMKECWVGAKTMRPLFIDIVPRLEAMLESSSGAE